MQFNDLRSPNGPVYGAVTITLENGFTSFTPPYLDASILKGGASASGHIPSYRTQVTVAPFYKEGQSPITASNGATFVGGDYKFYLPDFHYLMRSSVPPYYMSGPQTKRYVQLEPYHRAYAYRVTIPLSLQTHQDLSAGKPWFPDHIDLSGSTWPLRPEISFLLSNGEKVKAIDYIRHFDGTVHILGNSATDLLVNKQVLVNGVEQSYKIPVVGVNGQSAYADQNPNHLIFSSQRPMSMVEKIRVGFEFPLEQAAFATYPVGYLAGLFAYGNLNDVQNASVVGPCQTYGDAMLNPVGIENNSQIARKVYRSPFDNTEGALAAEYTFTDNFGNIGENTYTYSKPIKYQRSKYSTNKQFRRKWRIYLYSSGAAEGSQINVGYVNAVFKGLDGTEKTPEYRFVRDSISLGLFLPMGISSNGIAGGSIPMDLDNYLASKGEPGFINIQNADLATISRPSAALADWASRNKAIFDATGYNTFQDSGIYLYNQPSVAYVGVNGNVTTDIIDPGFLDNGSIQQPTGGGFHHGFIEFVASEPVCLELLKYAARDATDSTTVNKYASLEATAYCGDEREFFATRMYKSYYLTQDITTPAPDEYGQPTPAPDEYGQPTVTGRNYICYFYPTEMYPVQPTDDIGLFWTDASGTPIANGSQDLTNQHFTIYFNALNTVAEYLRNGIAKLVLNTDSLRDTYGVVSNLTMTYDIQTNVGIISFDSSAEAGSPASYNIPIEAVSIDGNNTVLESLYLTLTVNDPNSNTAYETVTWTHEGTSIVV